MSTSCNALKLRKGPYLVSYIPMKYLPALFFLSFSLVASDLWTAMLANPWVYEGEGQSCKHLLASGYQEALRMVNEMDEEDGCFIAVNEPGRIEIFCPQSNERIFMYMNLSSCESTTPLSQEKRGLAGGEHESLVDGFVERQLEKLSIKYPWVSLRERRCLQTQDLKPVITMKLFRSQCHSKFQYEDAVLELSCDQLDRRIVFFSHESLCQTFRR